MTQLLRFLIKIIIQTRFSGLLYSTKLKGLNLMEKEKIGNKNYLDSWKNAFNGIWYVIKIGTNSKVQIVISIVVIALGFLFKVSITEWVFLTFAIMIVFIAETVNTAIEETVNLVTKEFNPIAKVAKDVAAGAVVLSAINSVIIAILIIVSKINK